MAEYLKVTITFPDELFDELKEEDAMDTLRRFVDERCTEAVVKPEYGEGGRFHLEGVIKLISPMRAGNLKRTIASYYGVERPAWLMLEPSIKKHWMTIKPCNYLPGAINYVMKERDPRIIQKGFQTTWLQAQAALGEKNKELVAADKRIFLTDTSIYREVVKYRNENDLPKDDLRSILRYMAKANYSFMKVRNMKAFIAEYEANVGNDYVFESWLANFYPQL